RLALTAGADGTIHGLDVARRADAGTLRAHERGTACLAFLADNSFASGGGDGGVKLWTVGAPEPRLTLPPREAGVTALAAVPGSSLLLIGDGRGSIRLVDTGTGEVVRELHHGDAPVLALAATARHVVSLGGDAKVCLHLLATGARVDARSVAPSADVP